MIKTELRIGNIIYQHQVGMHPLDGKLIEKIIETGEDIENAQWWSPIPLTEEWLQKFGLNEIYRYSENNEGLIRRGIGEYSDDPKISAKQFNFDSKPSELVILWGLRQKIKYVHQLQNLYFALTGEELTPIK